MAAAPAWIDALLQKRSAIEETLGLPLGNMFACGEFGCAFDTTDPWAVKITRDPTEGPIWAEIADFHQSSPADAAGAARVRDVVRLKPDIRWKLKKYPVYAVVREEILPVWDEGKPVAKCGEKPTPSVTDYTLAQLQVPEELRSTFQDYRCMFSDTTLALLPEEAQQRVRDFAAVLVGLKEFRDAAGYAQHAAKLKSKKAAAQYRQLAQEGYQRGLTLIYNPIGAPIAKTLDGLFTKRDILLADVHWANVGWRVHEDINGRLAPTLIIFDPGFSTYTGAERVREAYVANNAEHLDMLDPDEVRLAMHVTMLDCDDFFDADDRAVANVASRYQ